MAYKLPNKNGSFLKSAKKWGIIGALGAGGFAGGAWLYGRGKKKQKKIVRKALYHRDIGKYAL
jgi:hypothetical protein